MRRNDRHAAAAQQQAGHQPQRAAVQNGYFKGAPVSKIICSAFVLSFLASFFLRTSRTISPGSSYLSSSHINSSYILRQQEWYWLLFSQFQAPFGKGQGLMTSALAVFWMRSVERELGSRWFSIFYVSQILLSAGIMAVLLVLLGEPAVLVRAVQAHFFPSTYSVSHKLVPWRFTGLYPFLGALLMWFHTTQPRKFPQLVTILGWNFSEKAPIYFGCWTLLWSDGWHSLLSSAVGCLSWILYRNLIHGIIDVPDSVARACFRVFRRWMDAPPPILVATGAAPPAQRTVARQAAAAAAAVQRPVRPVEPDPAAIEQLTNMGFARPQVVEALRATNNSVERAADRLLSGAVQ